MQSFSFTSPVRAWFHEQAPCFEDAEQRSRAQYPAIVKFGRGNFGWMDEWSTHFFDYIAFIVPPARAPICVVPQHLVIAQADAPQVFYMDIEWYDQMTDITPLWAALEMVKMCLSILERFFDDHFHNDEPTDDDEESCEYQHYITECSRVDKDAYDPLTQKGGYKHSYHVTTRCTRHHFANFKALGVFATSFIAYLFSDHARARYPDLYYGPGGKTCVIDSGVYTKNRALRLPLCAKSDTDRQVFRPCNLEAHGVPYDNEFLLRCVHAYIEPTTKPLSIEVCAVSVGRVPLPRGRHAPRPIHIPERPPVCEYLENALRSLERFDLVVSTDGRSINNIGPLDAVFQATVGCLGTYTVAQKKYWRCYQNWWGMSRLLQVFHSDQEKAYELWLLFVGRIGKNNDPVAQWRATQNSIITSQQIQGYSSQETRLSVIRRLARHFQHQERDLLALTAQQHGDSVCLVTPTKTHAAINLRVQDSPDDSVILFCSLCKAYRFLGYTYEVDSHVFDRRFVNQYEPLKLALTTRVTRSKGAQLRRRTLVVPAQMGTGKTELLTEMRSVARDKRVLILCMRVLLSHDMFTRLSGGDDPILPNLVHYQLQPGSLHAVDQLVLQLDSLLRIVHAGIFPQFDVVVLEEIESLLSHMSSSTLAGKRRRIGNALTRVVSSAGLVLVLDADVSSRGYKFLELTRPGIAPNIYRNLATPLARRHMVDISHEKWTSRIFLAIEARQNIFVVSNAKVEVESLAQLIEQRYPGTKVLVYTGASPNALKRTVSNCNLSWLEYQVVMWTPVISAGVNFNPPNIHFNRGFVYASDQSSCARDILQQAGRVRRLIDNTIHVHINTHIQQQNIAELTTIDGLMHHLQGNLDTLNTYLCVVADNVLRIQTRESEIIDVDDPLSNILLHNGLEYFRSAADFLKEYKRICQMHGDTVEIASDRIDTLVSRAELRSSASDIRTSYNAELTAAPVILTDQPPADDMDVSSASLIKKRLCDLLHVPDITDPDVMHVVSHPCFLVTLATFMLLAYPNEGRGLAIVAGMVFSKRVDVNVVPPDFTVDDFATFAQSLHLYQSTPIEYKALHVRVRAAVEMLRAVGLGSVFTTGSFNPHLVVDLPPDFYKDLQIPIFCKNIKFHEEPKNQQAHFKRFAAVFNILTGVKIVKKTGRGMVQGDSVNKWLSFAVLTASNTYAPIYRESGFVPKVLAPEINALIQ